MAAQSFSKAARLLPPGTPPKTQLQCEILSKAFEQTVAPEFWTTILSYLQAMPSFAEQMAFILHICEFRRDTPKNHKDNIFEKIVIPLIRSMLSRADFEYAIQLHDISLNTIAIAPHTQERWAWCFDRLNPLFIEAGEAYRKKLPELHIPTESKEPPLVAFIVDGAISGGSGLDLLIKILEQVAQAWKNNLSPVVYTVVAANPILVSKCAEWGIRIVDFDVQRNIPCANDDLTARLTSIRKQSSQDGVSVAIYFSTSEGLVCLASSIGLAPIQVYLTMGFCSLNVSRINAYIACASLNRGTKVIRGRLWRTLPLPFPDPFPAENSPKALAQLAEGAAIRKRLRHTYSTILGTLARPEKFDEEFVTIIARILTEIPGRRFCGLGCQRRSRHDITVWLDMFATHGIAGRCVFMGWVDTKIFARVLDVHLDCFGLPTALTMAETFSAGTAYLMRRGDESSNIGMAPMLTSVSDRIMIATRTIADSSGNCSPIPKRART